MSNLPKNKHPLPITLKECHARGWDYVDIVLVTGDGYVDHPSFGIALIGRLLEQNGYRVAILPQPRRESKDDFQRFGQPRLFFGITAGNLDSIVANYSGNGKVRNQDAYSTNGNPWWSSNKSKNNRRRPDRATIIYSQLARAAYKETVIVLGGLEASLRRFIHYDYKQNGLRGSVLTDAKADLLLYGMGEMAILDVANCLANNLPFTNLRGSCERLTEKQFKERFPSSDINSNLTVLPSWDQIHNISASFLEAEQSIDRHGRARSLKILVQKQQSAWVVQHPSHPPIKTAKLDEFYDLPFTRAPHPAMGDIPAYKMICHSITAVRGCSGNCSFCAITRHQGPATTSRSKKSILKEAQRISGMDNFRGTISDLGGPTANLFRTTCKIGSCKKHNCLYPKVCSQLHIDESGFLDVLKSISNIPGINHIFISSGLRMELLQKTPRLLKQILHNHTPGSLKIAPEHTESDILNLMQKESHSVLCDFVAQFRKIVQKDGKELQLTPYIISAHPGSTENHVKALIKKFQKLGLRVRQFQDFTPTPGTLSTAIFVTGLHPKTGRKLFIPKNQSDKLRQRRLLEKYFFKK